jgi:hypothetical protein
LVFFWVFLSFFLGIFYFCLHTFFRFIFLCYFFCLVPVITWRPLSIHVDVCIFGCVSFFRLLFSVIIFFNFSICIFCVVCCSAHFTAGGDVDNAALSSIGPVNLAIVTAARCAQRAKTEATEEAHMRVASRARPAQAVPDRDTVHTSKNAQQRLPRIAPNDCTMQSVAVHTEYT